MEKTDIILRHFKSLSITTYFVGIAALKLASSKNSPLRLSPFMVIPLGLSFLLSSIYNMVIKKKVYEGEPFIQLLRIIWELAWVLFALTLSLKLDDMIGWEWKTVFFPMWIAYAILVTVTLVTVSLLLTSISPVFCCKRCEGGRMLAYLWVNLHSLALCVFLPMILDAAAKASAAQASYSELVNVLIALCIYILFLLMLTLISMKSLG